MNNEIVIGYTAGVYDLFHIGHLNLLKNAKGMCDKLIVGVTTDDLVTYKGKHAMIPFEDRLEIIRSIKYVDAVVPQSDMDKLKMCKKVGASILYFPYTKGVSSTLINKALTQVRDTPETAIKREHIFIQGDE